MEPMARVDAVSPSISFIEVEKKYAGNQRRNMTMIRTSPTSGFWVDIFRSSNETSNEYRLHSIGQSVSVFDGTTPITMVTDYGHNDRSIGDDFLQNKLKSQGALNNNLHAVFSIKDPSINIDLEFNVFMPGRAGYTVYTNTEPSRQAADGIFRHDVRSPGLFVDIQGEAWDRPFVSVFEVVDPGQSRVTSVNRLSDGDLTAVEVVEVVEGGATYTVLSSESPSLVHNINGWEFRGTLAVIKEDGDDIEVYLGEGHYIKNKSIEIKSTDSNQVSASFRKTKGKTEVQCADVCDVIYEGRYSRIGAGQLVM